jgi:hypothetical protein
MIDAIPSTEVETVPAESIISILLSEGILAEGDGGCI